MASIKTSGVVEPRVKFNSIKIIRSICLGNKTSGSLSCWRATKYCVLRMFLRSYVVGYPNSLISYVDNNVILLTYLCHCQHHKYWIAVIEIQQYPFFSTISLLHVPVKNINPENITLDTQQKVMYILLHNNYFVEHSCLRQQWNVFWSSGKVPDIFVRY